MDVFGGYSESTNSSRDEIGVRVRAGASSCAKKKKKKKSRRNDPLKIVYISSPMKVRTCESKFRSLVQELTGKDSQVAMFMDVSSSHGTEETSQLGPVVSDPTSLQVAGVEDSVGLFELWPLSSYHSLFAAEQELEEEYVMDENLAAGGGCYGFGLEFDSPWHLLME